MVIGFVLCANLFVKGISMNDTFSILCSGWLDEGLNVDRSTLVSPQEVTLIYQVGRRCLCEIYLYFTFIGPSTILIWLSAKIFLPYFFMLFLNIVFFFRCTFILHTTPLQLCYRSVIVLR